MRVNRDGTAALVEAADRAGVRALVFVSSIAVRFEHDQHYAYAHAKRAAETCLRAGETPYTIVRPAIIVGPGAPVLDGFALLASLPWTPIFGAGDNRIQPIDVGDLAAALLDLADAEPANACVELGGPEVLTLRDWLARIRTARGKGPLRPLHLPLAATRSVLGAVEPVLLPVLPLTAGQLATFANDGVPEASSFLTERLPAMAPLDPALAPVPVALLPAEEADPALLATECRALVRHLLGQEAPDDVVEGYVAYHRERPPRARSPFEQELVAWARRGGLRARLADGYGRFVLPTSLLRQKLTLTLALLETSPRTFGRIDAPGPGGTGRSLLRLAGLGLVELATALLALAVLGPRHLLAARSTGS